MNKSLYDIIQKHHLHPYAYQKIGKVYIVYDNNKNYVIKLNTNNYDIYKYLLSRDFIYFPENFNKINDDYDLSLYINHIEVNEEQKINDYLTILALLHKKTSYKRELDLDEIKEKYENIQRNIQHLKEYYYHLNKKIDQELFLSPAMYYLVRNISLIYQILNILSFRLDKLYGNLKKEKSLRVALLHHNIDLDHLIINGHKYLISWDQAYFDNPIYDLLMFYRKYYEKIEIQDFLKIYETINLLSPFEKEMLIILLAIPKEISLANNTMLDIKNLYKEISYLKKIDSLLKIDENNK